jgi:PHS family inorganic phosphate transporter-like MFS transporter
MSGTASHHAGFAQIDKGYDPLLASNGDEFVHPEPHKPAGKSNFIAAIGNFNIQYNFSCLSIAIAIMNTAQDVAGDDDSPVPADFPEPVWAKYTILGLVFAGAVLGMIGMGFLGDVVGRRMGLIITLGFVVLGAAGSALFTWGDVGQVYGIMAFCRLLLGIGVGGIYPLSAATAFEGAGKNEHEATRVGWAFFWQTPGSMTPYLVAWILVQLPKSEYITSIQFRLVVGIGALLASIPLVALLRSPPTPVAASRQYLTPMSVLADHPEHFKTLIGTGLTWFLYDISYYGSVIFTPVILTNILGKGNSLNALCWQSLVVGAMGVPASASAIMLLKRKGGRWLSIWGFWLLVACFSAMAITYNASPDGNAAIKFVLFCLTSFALSWGPNVSTYVLPTSCYPAPVRSTFHGLSAASGKIGAVIGTFIYQPISSQYGLAAVMWLQVVLSALGAVVSIYCIPKEKDATAVEEVLDAEVMDESGYNRSAASSISEDVKF